MVAKLYKTRPALFRLVLNGFTKCDQLEEKVPILDSGFWTNYVRKFVDVIKTNVSNFYLNNTVPNAYQNLKVHCKV